MWRQLKKIQNKCKVNIEDKENKLYKDKDIKKYNYEISLVDGINIAFKIDNTNLNNDIKITK